MIYIGLRPTVLIEELTSEQVFGTLFSIQIIIVIAFDQSRVDRIGVTAVFQNILELIFWKILFEGLDRLLQVFKALFFVASLKKIGAYLTSGGRSPFQTHKIREQLLTLLAWKPDLLISDEHLKISEAFYCQLTYAVLWGAKRVS